MASPPRWRWIFDADLDQVRSFRLRFNFSMATSETYSLSELDSVQTRQSEHGTYVVEITNTNGHRFVVKGICSQKPGWPKTNAGRISEFVASHKIRQAAAVNLNDPGVTLREVGIMAPISPLVLGAALDELQQSLPDDVLKLTIDTGTALALAGRTARHFFGNPVANDEFSDVNRLSPLQLLLLFDLCIPTLNKIQHSQFVPLASVIEQSDERKVSGGVFSFGLSARFARYVAKSYRVQSVEPPISSDLQGVLSECRMIVATVAEVAHTTDRPLEPPKTYAGREVVFVDPTSAGRPSSMTIKAYRTGLSELSSGLDPEWTAPAESVDKLRQALQRIEKSAPIPMRNVFLRSCARAATADEILEARVWVLLRAIADSLAVTMPTFVPEPVSEARLKAAL
jgi:hypothetical protein